MAWYLNYSFFDAGKYITASIPASTSNVSLPLRIEWEIEFEARKNGNEFIVASTAFNTTSTLFFIRSGTDFELRSPSNSNWLVTTGVTLTNFNIFKIRSTFNGATATQTLHINGSLIATRNPTTAAIGEIASFFGLNSNSNRHGDFKYFKFTDFVTPANNRFYDANASGGTGATLPETIGGFNGNQSGTWPADNSEWVFYSSGTAYSDVLQGVTVTSSIGQIISTVSRASVLNGISVSSAVGNVQSNVDRNSTLSGISATMQVGDITSTVSRNSLLQGVSVSSEIGSIESTVSRGSVSYSSELEGVAISSSIGAIESSIARNSVLSGISSESLIGSITSQVSRNSMLQGITTTSFIGNITSNIIGAVTVTIDGYTISFAQEQHEIQFDQDHISAGFEKDLVSISWRH